MKASYNAPARRLRRRKSALARLPQLARMRPLDPTAKVRSQAVLDQERAALIDRIAGRRARLP